MAPQGPTQKHEAAELLTDWERFGCPTKTGRDWTLAEIQAAIDRGPHKSALEPDAIKHFADEVTDKVAKGQVRVILWDDIKDNCPHQLKVSPVAAIPHKSQAYRSILDLSFALRTRTATVTHWLAEDLMYPSNPTSSRSSIFILHEYVLLRYISTNIATLVIFLRCLSDCMCAEEQQAQSACEV